MKRAAPDNNRLAGLDQQREPPGEFDRAQGVIGGGGIGFGHGGSLRVYGARWPDLEIALTRPTALRPPAAYLVLSLVSGYAGGVVWRHRRGAAERLRAGRRPRSRGVTGPDDRQGIGRYSSAAAGPKMGIREEIYDKRGPGYAGVRMNLIPFLGASSGVVMKWVTRSEATVCIQRLETMRANV